MANNSDTQFTKIQDFRAHKYNTRLKARRSGDSAVLEDPSVSSSPLPSPSSDSVAGSTSSAAETVSLAVASRELKTRTAVSLILLIFLSSALAMFLVYSTFPDVSETEKDVFKFPRDIEQAKQLGDLLSRYTDQYFVQVYFGFLCTYIFLQTFAIPGSIFLSIISGFLFPFPLALFSVCFCSATGASFCYLLSYLVGRRLVQTYIPDRANNWSEKVDKHRDNLISYILFLRITPFLPNWFINIVSPVIGVPLFPFWVGSFFGVAPPSFVFIQAGTTLHQLTSTMDPITPETVGLLVLFAVLSLVPVLLKNKLKAKFE
jgi:uncharacterized membrane protein YdjX (TVP38/TMEM64 family)